jgi:hypothetical protein
MTTALMDNHIVFVAYGYPLAKKKEISEFICYAFLLHYEIKT